MKILPTTNAGDGWAWAMRIAFAKLFTEGTGEYDIEVEFYVPEDSIGDSGMNQLVVGLNDRNQIF